MLLEVVAGIGLLQCKLRYRCLYSAQRIELVRNKMYAHRVGILLLIACLATGDIYMHNPRGSNNRQDETWRGRKNNKRLFNSENNNRGGYNVGPFPGKMYYYGGSELMIQWANQHSCGDQNNNCNIVIQYMCDDKLRDGTTTDTAPTACHTNCDTDEAYGHHESLNYFEECHLRERNEGLFTADRKLKGTSAVYTRQNENGKRYGYECPEERDYYPYFGHSPWKDIAIMTNDPEICALAVEFSQNNKSRWICTFSNEDWAELRGRVIKDWEGGPVLFPYKESCEQSSMTIDGKTYQPIWKEIPSHGIPPPVCVPEQFSRDNHQGNTIGGEFLHYFWTIPNIDAEKCALRIRYNISTNDFDSWTTDHTSNLDWRNGKKGPKEIYERHGFQEDDDDIRRRNYYLKRDPVVNVFDWSGDRFVEAPGFKLALDPSQFGRTFQDRSHSFSIVQRPDEIPESATICNLNVRGKRGNIVQAFPSTEYDFVPTQLQSKTTDYVHIQWTGSDRNPFSSAGQGRRRTDRSNIVQLRQRPYAEGDLGSFITMGTNYPVEEPWYQNMFGASPTELRRLALAGDYEVGDTPGTTLNNGKAYFDFGLLKTDTEGTHNFFCTRNNNFSNRDQKAQIIVGK